ncbi:alkaline phosphatase family protein [Bordetella bronchialis]|uniref:Phosphoesterase n=1 Tax=Bordetella bronchialis TaxID=463025 RepID=A0A193FSZ8_9BORD|nr:alkaline phosphatase family protein [Bordetella bronchialis]ANN70877.1 phosphoesterase [Bordetella bronchialis]
MTPSKHSARARRAPLYASLTVIAASLVLAGCGGDDDSSSPPASSSNDTPPTMTMQGVVTGSNYVPGSKTNPTIDAAYFQNARVCIDANGNGKCDAAENPAVTDANGAFTLKTAAISPLLADIGTDSTNTASGAKVARRMALRVSAEEISDQGAGKIVISPMSSEIQRMVEDAGSSYAAEKANLATRLNVQPADVIADVHAAQGATRTALLYEANQLSNRYTYATSKLDRGDLYPDALAVAGGDPELTDKINVTPDTATTPETRKPITFLQAQQAAFNVEGIPRYDHLFVMFLENKGSNTILNQPYAPKIAKYLKDYNQLTNYFSTGQPSEPNYTAVGGGDDFGITDDSQWNCDAIGANAPKDPLPTADKPGLAASPFNPTGGNCGGTNHNISGPNMFTALENAGMTWRVYGESMNPGQDPRTDSVADSAITGIDNAYPNGIGNNPTPIPSNGTIPMPGNLYRTKHSPPMAFQDARLLPDFFFSNRTLGGGQFDANMANGTKYAVPANYEVDQLGKDLESGDVGQLNFLIPDQCDDMHSTTVNTAGGVPASDCSGNAIITRGDNYVDAIIRKIQASSLWKNTQRRSAIVIMFDEATASSGFNSCCGWNVSNSTVSLPLKQGPDGSFAPDTSIANYTEGNHGHGNSIFLIVTNQPQAPKGVVDSDAYSHFSFVRTMQDMFQVADPAVDASYLNRAKYTEKFIAEHLQMLPEFANSGDTHFDSVRPMNHAYVIPATYRQKQSTDAATPPQIGPDKTQVSVWAVK